MPIKRIFIFQSEESGKKNKGPKKAKAERKRSNKNKKESKPESSVTPSSTTSEDEDEDEEDMMETASEQPRLDSDIIEHNSNTVSLNRQASRSTEDLFTPVIKKHKWKVKKSLTKDDSGHTYSSSSSASSTTSTSAAVSHASNYSIPLN